MSSKQKLVPIKPTTNDNDGDEVANQNTHSLATLNKRNVSSSKFNSKPNLQAKLQHNNSRGISSRMLSKLNKTNSTISNSSSIASTSNYSSTYKSSEYSTDSTSEAERNEMEEEAFVITTLEEYSLLNDLVEQFQSCGCPIIVFDSNLTIEYLNNQAEEVFGFYSLAVMGEYLSELLSHESTMEIKRAIEDFIGDTSLDLNMSVSLSTSMKDLKIPYVLVSQQEKERRKKEVMKTRFLNGKNTLQKKAFPIKLKMMVFRKLEQLHFAAYINQLEQSEEDIKKLASIQFGEAITEISVIPIISINEQGTIQIFNSASTATFHYSKKEVIGKNVKMLCTPKIRMNHDDFLKRYLTTGEKRVVDCVRSVKGQTKEGKPIPIELRVSEIIDPISKKSSFVAFVRDTKSMVTHEEQITKITEKIFPKNIVHRLTAGEKVIDELQNCTMMYCDIVGFTELANGKSPSIVVHMLHDIFSCFDDIVYSKQHNSTLEKIKTIGDCYFVASGLDNDSSTNNKKQISKTNSNVNNMLTSPTNEIPSTNGTMCCVRAGLSMIQELEQLVSKNSDLIGDSSLQVRIGIHTSHRGVTAAVVGHMKRTYDLFGSDVLVTQLIEATGQPGQVHLSETSFNAIKSNEKLSFLFTPRYRANQEIYLEKQGVCKLPMNTYVSDLQ
ncbi:predicted protein [Naegleria gruberi]|uniref:Predicted protein n=1 Tax=Naegleria gruberi TaxID=5762 RepID=D2VUB8_NAEGR|nr:uncharacterized protein NAEGRDRAFT_72607 [Naegleria gruberi]EFC39664.1 predicted protein [Naegleria gruberi]|eukprot:XP_002672408.1 predicted protein [Naegleria gruberi strain NEG-M]